MFKISQPLTETEAIFPLKKKKAVYQQSTYVILLMFFQPKPVNVYLTSGFLQQVEPWGM